MKDKQKNGHREKISLEMHPGQSLRESVFETMRSAIVLGRLLPGERLLEIQLAEELGVSRTPVREAIRMLELEGFVRMESRRGAYVTPMSLNDLREMMQIRRALEMLCAELAANHATPEDILKMKEANVGFREAALENDHDAVVEWDTAFHECMYRSAGNDRLYKMIHTFREQMLRMRIDYVHNVSDGRHLIGQHEMIVDQIAAHKGKEAGEIAAEHIRQTETDMISDLMKRGQLKED